MIATSSAIQLVYLLLALTIVNIGMIAWQSHRLSVTTKDLFLLKYAYILLSKSIAAIEEKDVSTEQAVIEMHKVSKQVDVLKTKLEDLTI